jgi:hypothetical protein
VGQVVAELESLKLREKTLVVFVGDNGSTKGTHTVHGRPIHGKRGEINEGGRRVPLILNWPGTTPAGEVSKNLVCITDFFPNFTELAGGTLLTATASHPKPSASPASRASGPMCSYEATARCATPDEGSQARGISSTCVTPRGVKSPFPPTQPIPKPKRPAFGCRSHSMTWWPKIGWPQGVIE